MTKAETLLEQLKLEKLKVLLCMELRNDIAKLEAKYDYAEKGTTIKDKKLEWYIELRVKDDYEKTGNRLLFVWKWARDYNYTVDYLPLVQPDLLLSGHHISHDSINNVGLHPALAQVYKKISSLAYAGYDEAYLDDMTKWYKLREEIFSVKLCSGWFHD